METTLNVLRRMVSLFLLLVDGEKRKAGNVKRGNRQGVMEGGVVSINQFESDQLVGSGHCTHPLLGLALHAPSNPFPFPFSQPTHPFTILHPQKSLCIRWKRRGTFLLPLCALTDTDGFPL